MNFKYTGIFLFLQLLTLAEASTVIPGTAVTVKSFHAVQDFKTLHASVARHSFPIPINYWHGTKANRLFPVMEALAQRYPETALKLLPLDVMLYRYHAFPLIGEHTSSVFGVYADLKKTRFMDTSVYTPPEQSGFLGAGQTLCSWDYACGNYPAGYTSAVTQRLTKNDFAAPKIMQTIQQTMKVLKAPVISEFRLSNLVDRLYQLRMVNPQGFISSLNQVQPWAALNQLKSQRKRYFTQETSAFMLSFAENYLQHVEHPAEFWKKSNEFYTQLQAGVQSEEINRHEYDNMMKNVNDCRYGLDLPTFMRNNQNYLQSDVENRKRMALADQRRFSEERQRLLESLFDVLSIHSKSLQIRDPRALQMLFGEDIPILIGSSRNENDIPVHRAGEKGTEIVTVTSTPAIGQELDTLVLRKKDFPFIFQSLEKMGADFQSLNIVFLNELSIEKLPDSKSASKQNS